MAAIEMCRMNFGDSSSPHFISIRKKKSVGRMPMEMKRRTIYLIRQLGPGLCSDCLCASQTYNGTNEETVKHTWTADGGEKVSFDRSSVNNKPTEDEQIYISLLLFLFFLVQLSRRAIMGGSLMYQQDGVVLRAVLSGDDELIRSSRAAVSKQQQLSLNSSSLMNISLERKDDDEDIR